MKTQPTFFDFAAEVGLTKHFGGVEATEALIDLCCIGQGSHVLDVGCGAGATASLLTRKCGCRVTGLETWPKSWRPGSFCGTLLCTNAQE